METIDLKQTQQAWDGIAGAYDQYMTPWHDINFTKRLLGLAGLQREMKFLDLAAGTGALSIPAAQMGAHVTAVDISPAMIRLLEKRAKKEALPNIKGYVMDGHALDFLEDSFDVAGSQFGVMLFPDLPQGLREMVRVIKPGGTVLIIAFGPPEKVEFINFFFSALQKVVPGLKGLIPPPLPFQVSDPRVLYKRMQQAGLRDIRLTCEVEQFKYQSAAQLWNSVMSSNPIALRVTSGLLERQKEQVRQTLEDMVRLRAGQEEVATLKAELNVAVGRKV